MTELCPTPQYRMAPGAAGRAGDKSARPARTVRWRLTAFALGLVLPGFVFAGTLGWVFVSHEAERRPAELVKQAREVAALLDRDVAGLRATVAALATSPSIQSGDLGAFHLQAKAVAERFRMNLVLRGGDGRNLLHTAVPFGQPLPPPISTALDPLALVSGKGAVSGFLQGALVPGPLFTVSEPVRRTSAPPVLLVAGIPTARVQDAINGTSLPRGWTATVVDGAGIVLGGSEANEAAAGRPLTDVLRRRLAYGAARTWQSNVEASSFTAEFADGTAAVVGSAPVASGGWSVVVVAPATLGPLASSLVPLGLLAVAMLVVSAVLTRLIGMRLSEPLLALEAAAQDLAAGRMPPEAVPGGLQEVDRVARVLHETGAALKRAETERAEALSGVIGDVARDFNNSLAAVVSHLDLVRGTLPQGGAERRYAEDAMEGARRATALTARLLAFGRHSDGAEAEATDLGELVVSMSDPLRRALGRGVRLSVEACDEVLVGLEAGAVEAALLALARSARAAMPLGGVLTVRVGVAGVGERASDDASPPPGLVRGEYARLVVGRSGGDKGHRLLATGAQVARSGPVEHDCPLRDLATRCGGATRAVPGGTELWVPRLRRAGRRGFVLALAGADTGLLALTATEIAARPRLRVLAVDDDPLVLAGVVHMVTALGHDAESASSGEDALDLIAKDAGFDVLLTDNVMPGMHGLELIERLDALRPEVAVVLMTADALDDLPDGLLILQKPFLQAQLSGALDAAVEEARERAADHERAAAAAMVARGPRRIAGSRF